MLVVVGPSINDVTIGRGGGVSKIVTLCEKWEGEGNKKCDKYLKSVD